MAKTSKIYFWRFETFNWNNFLNGSEGRCTLMGPSEETEIKEEALGQSRKSQTGFELASILYVRLEMAGRMGVPRFYPQAILTLNSFRVPLCEQIFMNETKRALQSEVYCYCNYSVIVFFVVSRIQTFIPLPFI